MDKVRNALWNTFITTGKIAPYLLMCRLEEKGTASAKHTGDRFTDSRL